MDVSYFPPGINKVFSNETKTIIAIYLLIKYDQWLRDKTILLRTLSKEKQDELKRTELEFVTFAGVFSIRRDNGLVKPSGYVCVDLDNLENPDSLKKQIITECQFLALAFISPRGNGLKVVFRCNPTLNIKENYFAYSNYLMKRFKVQESSIDYACAHESRACFLCHDPEAFINPLLENGDIDAPHYLKIEETNQNIDQEDLQNEPLTNIFESPEFLYAPLDLDFDSRNSIKNFISLCRVNIKRHGEFVEGNRHNWVLGLAMICNSLGIPKEKALKYFRQVFKNHPAIIDAKHPFNEQNDLIKCFDDVYEKYEAEFESWQSDNEGFLTPYLPDEIFEKLPGFIKKLTNLFLDKRERDVFFLGLLTLLSTCFPLVQGVYAQRRIRANLFLFISAPAASGKGVLSWIERLGEEINDAFRNQYLIELKEYKSSQNEDDDEEESEQESEDLQEPIEKKLFIAADNTSPQIISNIGSNEVFGIIYDTEADTLTKANKSEHGHFSNVLRKGFHHESINYERKTNKQRIYIKAPAFSILISGTPGQVKRLVDDVENGLTSRFIFYSYASPAKWKDVFPEGDDLHYKFKSCSVELYVLSKPFLFDHLANRESEVLFELTNHQKQILNGWFDEKVKCVDHLYGTDIRGSVFRLGIIFFRIAMILATVRKAEATIGNPFPGDKIICSDEDFDTAKSLIGSLLHHTVSVYSLLKKRGAIKRHANIKDIYCDKLPSKFDRAKAMEIAELLQIKEKTAENYLTQFIKSEKLKRVSHNHYEKSQ